MGISEWIAVGSLILTIASSAVGVLLWIHKAHTQLILELEKLRREIVTIEGAWQQRLNNTEKELNSRVLEGPPWLKAMLQKQDKLLETLFKNTDIALQVARDHGVEIQEIRDKINGVESTSEKILSVLSKEKH